MDFGHGRSGLKEIGLGGSQLEMEDYVCIYIYDYIISLFQKELAEEFPRVAMRPLPCCGPAEFKQDSGIFLSHQHSSFSWTFISPSTDAFDDPKSLA